MRSSAGRSDVRSCSDGPSADADLRVGQEFVWRKRKVQGRRSLPYAAGRIVNGAMARAEISVIWPLVRERDAAQMSTDGDQDLPLFMPRLDPRRIGLGIRQLRPVNVLCILDLLLAAVIDEDRLAAPEHLDH